MLDNIHAFSRTRTAPTGYEKVRVLFHSIRSLQFVSSIIVGSIVFYFAWWLRHDKIPGGIPWTFIILILSTVITMLCLTVTIMFHCLTGLSPRVNLVFNSIMMAFWTLGFIMLSYWTWGTLTHVCNTDIWQTDDGVMVCRSYKALFTFALVGFLSTAAALALDVHIHRLATRFGTHVRLDNLDQKTNPNSRTVVDLRGPYADAENARSVNDLDGYPSRNSDAFEVPQVGYGAHQDKGANRTLLPQEEGGYAMPGGRFEEETGYNGGHEERVFGSK